MHLDQNWVPFTRLGIRARVGGVPARRRQQPARPRGEATLAADRLARCFMGMLHNARTYNTLTVSRVPYPSRGLRRQRNSPTVRRQSGGDHRQCSAATPLERATYRGNCGYHWLDKVAGASHPVSESLATSALSCSCLCSRTGHSATGSGTSSAC